MNRSQSHVHMPALRCFAHRRRRHESGRSPLPASVFQSRQGQGWQHVALGVHITLGVLAGFGLFRMLTKRLELCLCAGVLAEPLLPWTGCHSHAVASFQKHASHT